METFYNATHTGWYNETMSGLAELAEKPAAVLLGLDVVLKDLVGLMKQAQDTSAKMMELASVLREVDPARFKPYIDALDRLLEAMPSDRLEEGVEKGRGSPEDYGRATRAARADERREAARRGTSGSGSGPSASGSRGCSRETLRACGLLGP